MEREDAAAREGSLSPGRLGRWLCFTGAVVGALVLLSRPFTPSSLLGVASGTEPGTALGLVLSGAAGAVWRPGHERVRRFFVTVAAGAVIALGVVSFAECARWPAAPGALASILLGAALLSKDYRPAARVRPAECCLLLVALLALIALTGYLFHVAMLYGWTRLPGVGIGLSMAGGLLAIASGLLLQQSRGGVMRLVMSPGPGGVLLRRVGLPVVVAPAILGACVMWLLTRAGAADVRTVLAVTCSTTTVLGLAVLAVSAGPLNRMHEALDVSRERARDVIDRAPDGIFLTDSRGRYLEANAAAYRMLGYAREELVGKTIADLVPPEELERLGRLRKLLLSGAIDTSEWKLLRRDGSYVSVETSASMLPDGRWQCIARDISERKRLEEELRKAEATSSGILSLLADAVISVDPTGRVLLFNEGAEQVFGYAKEEMIGQSLDILIPERFRAAHREHLKRMAEEREGSRRMGQRGAGIYGLRRNGEEFPADAAVTKLDVDGEVVLTAVLRDISDLKRIEAEQRFLVDVGTVLASTLDLDATVASIGELLVRSFADFCIVYAVSEDGIDVRRLTTSVRDPAKRWIADALAQVPLGRVRPAEVWAQLEAARSVLFQHVSPEVEEAFAHSEAHLEIIRAIEAKSAILTPLHAHGKLQGALSVFSSNPKRVYTCSDVGFIEQVAQRAALALENARLYARAGRAIRIRDEILGIVAHDLRNPLSTVTLQAAILKRRADDAGCNLVKAGDVILRAATRMDRLIQDLLDVARMEQGRLSIAPQRVSTQKVLSDCVESEEHLAASSGLTLRLDTSEGLPDVCADRDRILQVLENLVGNAIKFTKPGGCIRVGAEPRGREVLFHVSDTGPGISAEDASRIFDRFWQVRKARSEGAGLGLTIVRGIVEAHGGRIWVESAVGRGSTFFFTVPVASEVTVQGAVAMQ